MGFRCVRTAKIVPLPDGLPAAVQWDVAPDGQRAAYVREKGEQRFAFEARVDGNRVRFRFDTRDIPRSQEILQHCCVKTISPFFSSQERMVQGILVEGGKMLRVADMPVGFRPNAAGPLRLDARQPFYWAVDSAAPAADHAVLRSYDGTAFVARVSLGPARHGRCMYVSKSAHKMAHTFGTHTDALCRRMTLGGVS
jgi:hypothetical protein